MVKQGTFYVVSDVWMGQAIVIADSREAAKAHQYRQMLAQQGYDEESDQTEVLREQFRAWPARAWPHHLEFDEAFDWIGEQAAHACTCEYYWHNPQDHDASCYSALESLTTKEGDDGPTTSNEAS
jgi:hypothetical protein